VLETAESTFQQDLNCDGVIGVNSARLPPRGPGGLNSDTVSQAHELAIVDNDSFMFRPKLNTSTIASSPGVIGDLPSSGSELLKLLHDAHSEEATFQWSGQFDAIGGSGDVTSTKAEIAGLHIADLIFH